MYVYRVLILQFKSIPVDGTWLTLFEPYQWRIQDFPGGGGANSQSGCANLLFCKFFAENCMKMKESGPGGACTWRLSWIRQ